MYYVGWNIINISKNGWHLPFMRNEVKRYTKPRVTACGLCQTFAESNDAQSAAEDSMRNIFLWFSPTNKLLWSRDVDMKLLRSSSIPETQTLFVLRLANLYKKNRHVCRPHFYQQIPRTRVYNFKQAAFCICMFH